VRWPGRVAAGTLCNTPVVTTDAFPTILEAVGLAPDANRKLDGESILPLLRQSGTLERDALFFHYPNYAFHKQNRLGGAIRQGDYKLIRWYDDDSFELYNLAADIGERHNLAVDQPALASKLQIQLDAWLQETAAKMPRLVP
jgi:arylsulfatase A